MNVFIIVLYSLNYTHWIKTKNMLQLPLFLISTPTYGVTISERLELYATDIYENSYPALLVHSFVIKFKILKAFDVWYTNRSDVYYTVLVRRWSKSYEEPHNNTYTVYYTKTDSVPLFAPAIPKA